MRKYAFLKPIFNFIVAGLVITTISRLFLFFLFKDRVVETQDFWYIFPIGLRMDLILLCYMSFLPAVIITFLPNQWIKFTNRFLVFYSFLFNKTLVLIKRFGSFRKVTYEFVKLHQGNLVRRNKYRNVSY